MHAMKSFISTGIITPGIYDNDISPARIEIKNAL